MFTTGFLPFSEPHRILQPDQGQDFADCGTNVQTLYAVGGWPGLDIFRQLIQNYKLYTKAVPPHTHILYLQIWIEMGLAGFVTFMWYIYRTIKNSVIGIYNSSLTLKTILAAGTAALCGILVTSLVEYSWYYPRVMVMFWVLWDNCRSDIFG